MDEKKAAIRRVAKAAKAEALEVAPLLNGVSVLELASALGCTEELAVAYVGSEHVALDWMGRAVIPAEVAASAVSAQRAESESLRAKQAAFDRAAAELAERRAAFGDAAYQRAHDHALEREKALARSSYAYIDGLQFIRSSPQAKSAARAARDAALAEWDKTHGGR